MCLFAIKEWSTGVKGLLSPSVENPPLPGSRTWEALVLQLSYQGEMDEGDRSNYSFVFVQLGNSRGWKWIFSFSVLLVVGFSLHPFITISSSSSWGNIAGMVMKPQQTFPKISHEQKLRERFLLKDRQRWQCASQVNCSMRCYTQEFSY